MDSNRHTTQICSLANVLFLSNEVPHNASKEAKVVSGKSVSGSSELKCMHCSMYLL